MGMEFKDVLVWLKSHLAEVELLLAALIFLLLVGIYWAWSAMPL